MRGDPPFLGIAADLLAGWAALCLVFISWTVIDIWPMDASQTRAHAIAEDPGRPTAWLVSVIGSIASLGAVGIVLIQTRNTSELES